MKTGWLARKPASHPPLTDLSPADPNPNIDLYFFVTFYDFLSAKNNVNVPSIF